MDKKSRDKINEKYMEEMRRQYEMDVVSNKIQESNRDYNFGWKNEHTFKTTGSGAGQVEQQEHIGTAAYEGRYSASDNGADYSQSVAQQYYKRQSAQSKMNLNNNTSNSYAENELHVGRDSVNYEGQNPDQIGQNYYISHKPQNNSNYNNHYNDNAYSSYQHTYNATAEESINNSLSAESKGMGSVSSYMDEHSISNQRFNATNYGNNHQFYNQSIAGNNNSSNIDVARNHYINLNQNKINGSTKYNIGDSIYNRPNMKSAEVELKAQFGNDYKIGSNRTGDIAADYKHNVTSVENYLSRNKIDAKNMSINDINRALSKGHIGNLNFSQNQEVQNALVELKKLRSQEEIVRRYGGAYGTLNNGLNSTIENATSQEIGAGNLRRMSQLSETGMLSPSKLGKLGNKLNSEVGSQLSSRVKISDVGGVGKITSKDISAVTSGKRWGAVAGQKYSTMRSFDMAKGVPGIGMASLNGTLNIKGGVVNGTNGGASTLFGKIGNSLLSGIKGGANRLTGNHIQNALTKKNVIKSMIGKNAFGLKQLPLKSLAIASAGSPGTVAITGILAMTLLTSSTVTHTTAVYNAFQSAEDIYNTGYIEKLNSYPENVAIQAGINSTYEKQLAYEQNMSNYHEAEDGIKDGEHIIEDAYKEGLPSETWMIKKDNLLGNNTEKEEFDSLYEESKERQTINISENISDKTKNLEAAVKKDVDVVDTGIALNNDDYSGYNLDEYWGPISHLFTYKAGGVSAPGDKDNHLLNAEYKKDTRANGKITFATPKYHLDTWTDEAGNEHIKEPRMIVVDGIGVIGKANLFGTGGLIGDASADGWIYADGTSKGGHWEMTQMPKHDVGDRVPEAEFDVEQIIARYELRNDEDEPYIAIDTNSKAYKNRSYELTNYTTDYLFYGAKYTQYKTEQKYEDRQNTDPMDNLKSGVSILNYGEKVHDIDNDMIAYGISNDRNAQKEKYFEEVGDINQNTDGPEGQAYKMALLQAKGQEIMQRAYNLTKMYQAINAVALGMTDEDRECKTFFKTVDLDLYKEIATRMNEENFSLKTYYPSDYKHNNESGSFRVGMYENFTNPLGEKVNEVQLKNSRDMKQCYIYYDIKEPITGYNTGAPTWPADPKPKWSPTLHSENVEHGVYKVLVPYSYYSQGSLKIIYPHVGLQDLIYFSNNSTNKTADGKTKFTSEYVHDVKIHDKNIKAGESDAYNPKAEPYREWRENNKKNEWVGWWKKNNKTSKSALAQDIALCYYELTVEDWERIMGGIWYPKDNTLDEKFDNYYKEDENGNPVKRSGLHKIGEDSAKWNIEGIGSGQLTELALGGPYYLNQMTIQSKCSRKGLCNFTTYMMIASLCNNTKFSLDFLADKAEEWCDADGFFRQQATCMNEYGFSVSGNITTNIPDNIKQSIDKGRPVILHIRGYWNQQHPVTTDSHDLHTTGNGHFLLIRGYDENGVYLADPGRSANSKSDFEVSWADLGRASDMYIRKVNW